MRILSLPSGRCVPLSSKCHGTALLAGINSEIFANSKNLKVPVKQLQPEVFGWPQIPC